MVHVHINGMINVFFCVLLFFTPVVYCIRYLALTVNFDYCFYAENIFVSDLDQLPATGMRNFKEQLVRFSHFVLQSTALDVRTNTKLS